MPQFRPLPREETFEETGTVETPGEQPIVRVTSTLSGSPYGTSNMPVVLLSGPFAATTTDSLKMFAQGRSTTDEHLSLNAALQNVLSAKSSSTSRMLVIPADKKLQQRRQASVTATSIRRLNPRLRHGLILFITLAVMIGTLITLAPLADSQNGSVLGSLGSWVHSAQIGWQPQAHVSQTQVPAPNHYLPPMNLPNSPYVAIAKQDAIDAGISPIYFSRQINQESGYNPNAVSVTDAEGIAQFEPGTAAGLGINPWNPTDALRGAANLMASYYHKYGDYAKGLAAYNAGAGTLQGAEYACGNSWLSCMPGQTQNYVYVIMGI